MIKVINPFNRKEGAFDTSANLCDCKCYSLKDDHDDGRTASRWTLNLHCGCSCTDTVKDNKSANRNLDKER